MAYEVPQQIRERLVTAIDDLINAVGQEAAKAVLVSLTNIEPVVLEPETITEDDSWLEFIHEDFMIDSSEPSPSKSPSPIGKIEDQSLPTAVSQIGDQRSDRAVSLHTANLISPMRIATSGSCEDNQELRAYPKKGRLDCNILEAVVQRLPRCDLLDCLETQWQTLTTEGIYMTPSRQVLTWDLEDCSERTRRLHSHLILRHLDVENDLYQWRRSIAERRNLDGYNSFFAEVQAKQRTRKQTRRRGERSSCKAQVEYLAHLYTDRTPRDYKRAKQGLQKDLRNGRRWSILIDGFVTDDGNHIPGLGLGFLLLCGSATARKMLSNYLFQ